ncbi:DUF4233 domain-containing protein [Calidifontibacter sp. DB0510]|uniref:DUF4233 domain-containing protein n=1 Tax=Metallococcus carri TaxID=1656884 RepID=A0A967B0Q5_9MICO|nr:DUF4233 domain-containing protein [Metallococcus carri]NHN55899.1 DUF4233 domain-containing protein [Metallococcus carri]NOP38413.1 DUF4233 domain-containing protein [Calidifontibacter sp. DB2511S]
MSRLLFYGVGERMTRRLAAVVIGSQSLAIFFGTLVAEALARARGESAHTAYLIIGLVIAGLCIVAAGCLRRPWGVTLGWALQVVTIASAVIVPMMLIVGVVFAALWVTALVQGRRMDELTQDYLRSNG